MEPEVTHLGIRTKLSFVGAKAELRINSDFLTLDEIGSDDVRSIVVSDVAEGGRSVRMEFPAKYNVGVAPEGLLTPSATKDVKIKVSKGPEGEQSIYLDYLFERFEKSLEYFIYDPTVKESTKISFESGSGAVFGLFFLIVQVFAD
jgi:hypothetical protein